LEPLKIILADLREGKKRGRNQITNDALIERTILAMRSCEAEVSTAMAALK